MAPFSLSTRPRRSLPEGYQFGDGRVGRGIGIRFKKAFDLVATVQSSRVSFSLPWRAPHENDAERIEPFTTDRDLGDEA